MRCLAVLKCQAQKRHTEHSGGRHGESPLLSEQGQGSYHTHEPSRKLACPGQIYCQYQPSPLPHLFRGSFPSQVAHTTLPSSQKHSWFGMGCREGLTTDSWHEIRDLFPPRVKRESSPLRGCRAESTGRGGSQPTSSCREPSKYVIHPPLLASAHSLSDKLLLIL